MLRKAEEDTDDAALPCDTAFFQSFDRLVEAAAALLQLAGAAAGIVAAAAWPVQVPVDDVDSALQAVQLRPEGRSIEEVEEWARGCFAYLKMVRIAQ